MAVAGAMPRATLVELVIVIVVGMVTIPFFYLFPSDRQLTMIPNQRSRSKRFLGRSDYFPKVLPLVGSFRWSEGAVPTLQELFGFSSCPSGNIEFVSSHCGNLSRGLFLSD
jgi:hypothetical protein